jgi:hypothetical protein
VIATSSGAAAAYVRDRLANMRVAMFLELGTTLGGSPAPISPGSFTRDFSSSSSA